MSGVASVLVDHCVIVNGQTVRYVKVPQTRRWGPHAVTMDVLRVQGKRRGSNEEWLRRELAAIGAIGSAAVHGELRVFTSFELSAERLKSRMGGRGFTGDLWKDVAFEHATSPIDRSRIMASLTLHDMSSQENREDFCRRLLTLAKDPERARRYSAFQLTPFEQESLERLDEFAGLCESVGPSRYVDAFHLWTAVRNGIDYFLTTDNKFLTALRNQHGDATLLSRAVLPTELCDALGLSPMPLPITEGAIVPFGLESG